MRLLRLAFLLSTVASGRICAQDAQQAQMRMMNRALGAECTHCHTEGDWKRGDKPEFAAAGRMNKMVQGLDTGILRDLGGVTCWSCHRGNLKPVRMPRAGWEERLARWPDTLKLSVEDAKKPNREIYKNIQTMGDAPAGGLPMTMSVFAAALGVGCDYCHIPGDWASDQKPTKITSRVMLRIFGEIPKYFEKDHQPSMQCYSCHQGAPKPERQPRG